MGKQSKSQWDFGELFPPEDLRVRREASTEQVPPSQAAMPDEPQTPAQKILSVTELTSQVKRLLEQHVGAIWVTGEVTNFRAQGSGHMYFTLKDAGSQLSCVLFRGATVSHRELLKDGQKLLLQGDVTVYEARGQYQLIVRAVELQGIGALQIAFEKLKQKLQSEGLFASERKRPLPMYPQRIGLVTSPTGAAIRDVLHVVRRRNPSLEIILVPCRVQGDGAAGEIARAIRLLNELNAGSSRREETPSENVFSQSLVTSAAAKSFLDAILLTRGGGSLEDLWAFNEEVVARAIFDSGVPVVSAVGHEIDFTISDFVADLRAATPSAAAEIITEGVFSSCEFVSEATARIRWLCVQQIEGKREWLDNTTQRLARLHPRRRFNEWLQRLDDLQNSLARCARAGTRQQQVALRNLRERLLRVRPAQLLKQRCELLHQQTERLHELARHQLRERRNQIQASEARLRLLGPEQVLARGYSITTDAATGKVVRSAAGVKAGQRLRTRLKAGEIESRVEK